MNGRLSLFLFDLAETIRVGIAWIHGTASFTSLHIQSERGFLVQIDPMDLERLRQRGNAGRVGGKGSVRRKKQPQHRTNTTDDKRLQSTLKRLGVNPIPGIEEVNLFMDDNNVLHYSCPKVQASITANTYVVSGVSQMKSLSELLPEIITQMGPDSLANLKRMAEQMQMHHGSQMPQIIEDDDDEVPDLVENFEEASETTTTTTTH